MTSESNDNKRLIYFMLAASLSFFAIQYIMDVTGMNPPPKKPAGAAKNARPGVPIDDPKAVDAAAAKADAPAKADVAAGDDAPKSDPPALKVPTIEVVRPDDLLLGSLKKDGPGSGYHIEVQLEQKGAGILSVTSALYEAEFEENKPKHRALEILKAKSSPNAPPLPPSLAMTLVNPRDHGVDPADAAAAGIALAGGGELPLDGVVWEVVRDDQNRIVRPISKTEAARGRARCPRPSPGSSRARKSSSRRASTALTW